MEPTAAVVVGLATTAGVAEVPRPPWVVAAYGVWKRVR